MIREALPRHLYAHTRWDIDFDALAGKRVAVLGCGASAFDNASVALERGAREVHMFFRRKKLVNVNAYRWAEFVGFLRHLGDLPDADKWRFIHRIAQMGQLPPTDTYRRASAHAGFHLHPGSAWKGLAMRGDTVVITTEQRDVRGRLRHRRHRFRDRSASSVPSSCTSSRTSRVGQTATYPLRELRNEDLLRHPYLGQRLRVYRADAGQRAPTQVSLQLHLRRARQLGVRRGQHLGHEVLGAARGRRNHVFVLRRRQRHLFSEFVRLRRQGVRMTRAVASYARRPPRGGRARDDFLARG